MGLGLGFGLLFGVRASLSEMLLGFGLLTTGLLMLALISQGHIRSVVLVMAVGLVSGFVISEFRKGDVAPAYTAQTTGVIEGSLLTDPRVARSGTSAWFSWVDGRGEFREGRVYLPAGVEAARSDRLKVTGSTYGDGSYTTLATWEAVPVERAGWLERQRSSIRRHVSTQMVAYVPGSPGSLTLGLLIGDDTGLSKREADNLRRSGLSHITAVSGWNVSVIVAAVGAVFAAIGARGWHWLTLQLALIGCYVWIVGLEPPIQRAAIMGCVALVALQFGRPAHMLTLLTLVAGAMAVWNPSVFSSLSFLLSFLSMLGLVVAARVTIGMNGWRAVIVAPVVAATAAGIATAPLLASTFGTVALMTVPANLLAGPLIPFATFAGIAVVLVSWVPFAAEIVGWIGWALATAVLGISRLFASVPGGHHEIAPLGTAATMTIYAALFIVVAPFVPEARAAGRRFESWFRSAPAVAAAGVMSAACLLTAGVMLV